MNFCASTQYIIFLVCKLRKNKKEKSISNILGQSLKALLRETEDLDYDFC